VRAVQRELPADHVGSERQRMTIHRRRLSGYWHYWLAIAILVAIVVSALATNYYGLRP
jgi:hypothetical protein